MTPANGWIRLHRKIFADRQFKSEYCQEFAFLHLVALAEFQVEEDADIPRGCLYTSLPDLSRTWRVPKHKVHRWLNTFATKGMLEYRKVQRDDNANATQTLYITIAEYDTYNPRRNANRTQTERDVQRKETATSLLGFAGAPAPSSYEEDEEVKKKREMSLSVETVWEKYLEVTGRDNRTTKTPERAKWIRNCLKWFGLKQVLNGTVNFGNDPWPERPNFNDPKYIYKSRADMEKWILLDAEAGTPEGKRLREIERIMEKG